MNSDLKDRAEGVLVGLAAGDRNGGPVRMALRLAASLERHQGFDVEDIGRRYLEWWREDGFDTGPIAARVLSLVDSGMSFADATGAADVEAGGLTAGCNPAHRASPIASLKTLRDRDLAGFATAEAKLTHRHPLAGDVSAAVASLCRGLIRGQSWVAAIARARSGRLPETRLALADPPREDPGRSGFAPEALSAAIYFVGTSPSFDQALRDAISFAGPANYCPVLVGAIGGARWGVSNVPDDATRHLGEFFTVVRQHARDLAEGW